MNLKDEKRLLIFEYFNYFIVFQLVLFSLDKKISLPKAMFRTSNSCKF